MMGCGWFYHYKFTAAQQQAEADGSPCISLSARSLA